MRVAMFQMFSELTNVDGNLAKIAKAAEAAAVMGANLLVTPEMSVTGYALEAATATMAEPADGPIATKLQAIADRFKIALVAGFAERDGDTIFNSVALSQPGKPQRVYRKCHLYGDMERVAFTPSDTGPELFEIGGLKAAMLICYDVEFPEIVRSIGLSGAELLIVPTALATTPANRRIPERILPARAMENQLFILYTDLCGNDGVLNYEGHSVAVAPDGSFLCRAGSGECLMFADLDPAAYDESRAELPYLRDRRPELYGAVTATKA